MKLALVFLACNDVSLPEADVPHLPPPIRKVKFAEFSGYVQQPFGEAQKKQIILLPPKLKPLQCNRSPKDTILLYTDEQNKALAVNYLAKIHPDLPVIEPQICREDQ